MANRTSNTLNKNSLIIAMIAFITAALFIAPRLFGYLPFLLLVIGFISWKQSDQHTSIASLFNKQRVLEHLKGKKFILFASLALFTVMIISIFWSIDSENSAKRVIKVISLGVSGGLAWWFVHHTPKNIFLKDWKLGLLSGGFMALVYFLVTTLDARFMDAHLSIPIHGFFYMAHNTGLNYLNRSLCIFAIFIPLFLTLMGRETKKENIGSALFLIICAIAIYGGIAETAKLTFLLIIFFYYIFPVKYKSIWFGIGAITTILILTAPYISIWVFEHYGQAIHNNAILGQGGAHGGDRLEIYNFVSHYILQNPLYGYGIEATRMIKDFQSDFLFHGSNRVLHPHNFALQVWIEMGLIGAISLSVLFIAFYRILYKNTIRGAGNGVIYYEAYYTVRTSLAMMVGFLALVSFGYGLWQGWVIGAIASMPTLLHLLKAEQNHS